MVNKFKDQVAVITGAGSGIGRAIAIGLSKKKVRLILLGRDGKKLQQVAAIARRFTSTAKCYALDLAEDENVRGFGGQLRKEFMNVDILVHSAGIITLGPSVRTSLNDLDRQFRINTRAPLALTQVLLPMIKPHSGQIVFINSSAVMNPGTINGIYAATKSALKTMTDSLRQELNNKGFRILSIYLGRTATEMQRQVFRFENVTYSPERLIQPDDVASTVIQTLGLPRTIEVTDIYARPGAPFR